MIFIFLFVVVLLISALHYLIYKTFLHFGFVENKVQIISLRVLFVFLALIFPVVEMTAKKSDALLIKLLYPFSAVWIGTMYVLFVVSLIYWILFGISKVLMLDFKSKLIGGVLFSLALFISVYGVWNSNVVKVRRVTVPVSNLPEIWKNRKAVLVADTHFGDVRGENFSRKVVRIINEQNPDIVFLAGDYYDGVKVDAQKMAEPWESISAPLGIYFVNGNHEHYGDTAIFNTAVANAGLHILENKKVLIDGMQIVGTDYSDTTSKAKFKSTLDQIAIDKTKPSILIKHVPDNIDVARDYGVSLQVSGHTHSGQVFPFNLLVHKIFKGFDHGLKNLGETQVYTTSGIGTWGPPQRLGTNAEVVVITFEEK